MVDMDREEMLIRWRTSAALALTLVAFALGYFLLPLFFQFPLQASARLALASQAGAFVLVWLLIGIGMVSTARRFSRKDIAGSAYAPPSEKLAVKVAFLQNTLEQCVLTIFAFLAFAATFEGEWLALLPVCVILFAIGRYSFYRGYPHGAGARAFGMGLTLLPGTLLLIGTMAMSLWGIYIEYWSR